MDNKQNNAAKLMSVQLLYYDWRKTIFMKLCKLFAHKTFELALRTLQIWNQVARSTITMALNGDNLSEYQILNIIIKTPS